MLTVVAPRERGWRSRIPAGVCLRFRLKAYPPAVRDIQGSRTTESSNSELYTLTSDDDMSDEEDDGEESLEELRLFTVPVFSLPRSTSKSQPPPSIGPSASSTRLLVR